MQTKQKFFEVMLLCCDWDGFMSIKFLFLLVENNKTSVETKFHGRRVDINEVIKLQKVTFF